jgi:hypothetical protein
VNSRVLIACPVSNRAWILPYYLEKIYNLEYEKKLIDIYWIVNNSNDNSFELLNEFKIKYSHEYNSIKIKIDNNRNVKQDIRNIEIRKGYIYDWLSYLRNNILEYCIKIDCDYLFSSDSDILFKSDTLIRLVEHNKHVVSSLIYNGYMYVGFDEAYKYPNILNKISNQGYMPIVNYRIKNPDKNLYGTLIECDFTGACVLMSREVCKKSKYGWHDQGEDEVWSRTAKENGFKLYCDISLYNNHIMSQQCLQLFLENKLR